MLQDIIDPIDFRLMAIEAEKSLLVVKKNVEKLLNEYEDVVNTNDKLKYELAKIRAQIDNMGN